MSMLKYGKCFNQTKNSVVHSPLPILRCRLILPTSESLFFSGFSSSVSCGSCGGGLRGIGGAGLASEYKTF